MGRKSTTGQWGIRHVGKRIGTAGYLNKVEAKAQPYEFGYGTIWATSQRGAKIKLRRILREK